MSMLKILKVFSREQYVYLIKQLELKGWIKTFHSKQEIFNYLNTIVSFDSVGRITLTLKEKIQYHRRFNPNHAIPSTIRLTLYLKEW